MDPTTEQLIGECLVSRDALSPEALARCRQEADRLRREGRAVAWIDVLCRHGGLTREHWRDIEAQAREQILDQDRVLARIILKNALAEPFSVRQALAHTEQALSVNGLDASRLLARLRESGALTSENEARVLKAFERLSSRRPAAPPTDAAAPDPPAGASPARPDEVVVCERLLGIFATEGGEGSAMRALERHYGSDEFFVRTAEAIGLLRPDQARQALAIAESPAQEGKEPSLENELAQQRVLSRDGAAHVRATVRFLASRAKDRFVLEALAQVGAIGESLCARWLEEQHRAFYDQGVILRLRSRFAVIESPPASKVEGADDPVTETLPTSAAQTPVNERTPERPSPATAAAPSPADADRAKNASAPFSVPDPDDIALAPPDPALVETPDALEDDDEEPEQELLLIEDDEEDIATRNREIPKKLVRRGPSDSSVVLEFNEHLVPEVASRGSARDRSRVAARKPKPEAASKPPRERTRLKKRSGLRPKERPRVRSNVSAPSATSDPAMAKNSPVEDLEEFEARVDAQRRAAHGDHGAKRTKGHRFAKPGDDTYVDDVRALFDDDELEELAQEYEAKRASSSTRAEKTRANPSGARANPSGARDNPSGARDNPSGARANPSGARDNPSGARANPSGARDKARSGVGVRERGRPTDVRDTQRPPLEDDDLEELDIDDEDLY